MKISDSKNRPVFDLVVMGSVREFSLESAAYADGEPLPDEELDFIVERYPEVLERAAWENGRKSYV